MKAVWRNAIAVAALPLLFAGRLGAQQADVIRGQVLAEDGEPVVRASIQVKSIPSNLARTATTDANGRYALTYANGEGDYWITVTAIGFAPKRFELKRLADEQVLIGNVKLARSGIVLDAVEVQGARVRPNRAGEVDATGTEKTLAATSGDPTQAGSLAALAASAPGVQLIPGADGNPDQFSVFGLSGEQNNATLNGLSFGGADVPRDAAMRAMLGTSPWDVSRGGFSGGQISLSTQSGSNFSSRSLSSLLNGPGMQWTDRAGRALGAEYRSASVGAAMSGPIALDRSFYGVGFQFDRRLSDMSNLDVANPFALQLAGVAADSVARLTTIMSQLGVPRTAPGLPSLRRTDRALLLGSIDFAPPRSTSGQALNFTGVGSFTRLSSPFAQVTGFPTNDAKSLSWFGAGQLRHTNYFAAGVLSESSAGIMASDRTTDPYLAMPNGAVRVASALDDGSTGIAGLTFGGSPMQQTSNRSMGAMGQNQLSWFSRNSKHRLKLATSLRYETSAQDFSTNRLGTFRYNSLTDLELNRPASFTRVLTDRVSASRQVIAGLSIGDFYRATSDVQVQYGVRLDGNRFLTTPQANASLATALGVDNSALPNRVYVSPRVGFSWTYGQSDQLAIGNGFARTPRAVVRGGVGFFQNTPPAQIASGALLNTGRSDGSQQVICVGSAVPVPNWSAYASDPTLVPTACADGTTTSGFGSAAPSVTMFDEQFAAARSLRSNLSWSGALARRFVATIDATVSRNLQQPGVYDANFAGVTQFTLDNERGRPVYAPAASIVTSSGSIAPGQSRVAPAFGSVLMQRSNLAGTSRQVSLSVQPLVFSSRYSWSLTYVLATVDDEVFGFASTTGDPRLVERSRSGMDSRHQLQYSLAYNFFDWVPVSWSGSVRSGRPYTPIVGGDVNGDGFTNDRAFIFDPASDAPMAVLLASASSEARRCIESQVDRLAGRNSCQGPRTTTSNLTIAFNPVKFRLPQRVNLSLFVNNAFGVVDLLLHGENDRRGWGQAAMPDQTLLLVRGFDASANRFRYEVNPRFGATDPNRTINRNPVVITAQVKLDVGYTRERQLLTQSLDRGRTRAGTKTTEQDMRSMGVALLPPNPIAMILGQADSLRLTRLQADSLATLNRKYAIAYETIWLPVGKYLSSLPVEYDSGDAYQRYRRARQASIDMLAGLVPSVRALLAPE